MPLAVYVLGLAIFAQGTSELMIAGLLPQIAGGLHVSIPTAGLLISGFAIGMIIGAPALTIATRRLPRRTALLMFLVAFTIMHVVGALAPDYAVLLVSRMVAAFVYAGFWAVATVSVIDMVPANVRGRAMSVVVGGLTIATVAGLPAGTFLGERLGWRSAFWAVAALSALTMPAVFAVLSSRRTSPDRPARLANTDRPTVRPDLETAELGLRAELRAMLSTRLLLAYLTTALATGAVLVTFSYLTPLLTSTTGIASGWIPAILVLYGAGAIAGITIGGRFADANARASLYAGLGGVIVVSVLIAMFARSEGVMIGCVFLLGAFGFGVNPALNTRAFSAAGQARALAAGTNTSAFNIGITVGPWLGGLAIGAGLGYQWTGWIGAALAAAGIASVALPDVIATGPDRRRTRADRRLVAADQVTCDVPRCDHPA